MAALRLTELNSFLLIVDVQEKLLPPMPNAVGFIRDIGFLIDAAKLLQVPVAATEQYPQGLGPTTVELARRLPAVIPAKTTFSCCGAQGMMAKLRVSGCKNIVLVGMETHVCIMQTALDLLGEGLNVFIPVDAIRARFQIDHDVALRRLEKAGAVLTTVETTAFEWLGGSQHPQFKAVSRMIRERMAAL